MIFVITDNYVRHMITGEHATICVVEGDASPKALLDAYHQRLRTEDANQQSYYRAFPEKAPEFPKQPWWMSYSRFRNSAAVLKWQDDYAEHGKRYLTYCDAYKPNDVIPELEDYLRANGYRIIPHELV